MRINNNLMALNTHRQLGVTAGSQTKSMEKLSSGYRINRAGDDAAGLAISEKMRGQIRGLNQASRNSQDAISMIQTAEGALNETQAILQRMRELAVQSANDTNVNADRTSIQNEIDQLSTEITRIADTTEFNTQKLLNGGLSNIQFQIGANEGQNMKLSIGDMRADSLKVVSDTINIGSKGEGIKSISADADFKIEGSSVTATKGGAVGAEMKASGTISKDGYAKDIKFSYAEGITNTGKVTFNGDNGINLTATGSDIPWDKIKTSGGAANHSITIKASGGEMAVLIDVENSDGDDFDIADAVSANADGSFTYDAHGVSFTLSSGDYAKLAGKDVVIDLATNKPSGKAVDFTGKIDTNSNYKQTKSGASVAKFSGGAIAMDATASGWLGGDKVIVSGAGLESSGGTITVKIMSGSAAVSTDTYSLSGDAFFSGVGSSNEFVYNNHGVSFKLDVGTAKQVQASGAIESFETSATVSSTNKFVFTATDDSGAVKTFSGSLAAGEYGLKEIADEINKIADAAGKFGGDFAKVEDGTIKLSTDATGSDAVIKVEDDGGLDAIFTTSATKNGSDSSVNMTLTDGDGNAINQSVAASAKSATFTDSDGNQATVKLKGYSTLDNVNVAENFAASTISKDVAGIDVSSKEAASKAITTINDAIESVSAERAKLGAVQNRLEHTIKNLDTSSENLQASESRIRDVDMAKEMMEFTKNNILQQAAQSMLAQANQAPQGVLQLLR